VFSRSVAGKEKRIGLHLETKEIKITAMIQKTESREKTGTLSPLREQCVSAFRYMVQSRVLDEKMASLYRGGKIHGGVFLGKGQEALSASIGVSLRKGDIFAPVIRDGAGRLAFGEPLSDSIRTYMGSVLGPMRGRDGNVHHGHPREGLLAMISHLGAMISVVNGMLMARRFKKISNVVGAVSVGDGATSTGAFHEAVNQAAVEKLPLVIVVANNQFAYSTPNNRQFACKNLVDKAPGYGITGHTVDGTDLVECMQVVSKAVSLARQGHGPQMVVASLLRLCGHGEHDDFSYIDAKMKNSPLGRDCMQVAESELISLGWMDLSAIKELQKETVRKVEEAVAVIQHEPTPDPYKEDWCALSSRHLVDVFQTP